ncbi:hypothetical protein A3B18_02415 [Candidatus Giovannonibacteria bacterium RIFCSPLOWO2_01_FULL_46_13]|uniref:Uncharacterized protein n=1 Tax=Candidatus Giovannonibacteria bacterium RIFCSPLOWO2_01_FULL_46_13 TaxID=1798352 RepID=A0A1F5X510_9BACT|nr:MAG: hypothetical protein A3B18_02415 [Candidatus Giovannonibacteria bacterium RIFCSPLOWO2_01_FULL_46_13]
MSFFDKLEEIREKPVEKKRRILFFSMAISMAIIIILWASFVTFQDEPEKSGSSGPSPWEVIKNSFENVRR